MKKIRIFVSESDTAKSVVQQIKRIYPDAKKDDPFVEIQISLHRNSKPDIIDNIIGEIDNANFLEFRDRYYFDHI